MDCGDRKELRMYLLFNIDLRIWILYYACRQTSIKKMFPLRNAWRFFNKIQKSLLNNDNLKKTYTEKICFLIFTILDGKIATVRDLQQKL